MSSSNPRGGPPSRYNDRNEYTEYGKSRRKNFYSPNTTTSRRDYKSTGPGSSSLSHSLNSDNNNSTNSINGSAPLPSQSNINQLHHQQPPSSASSNSSNISSSSGRGPYGTGPNVRDNRNSYPGANTKVNQPYTSYYPSYGSYSNKSNPSGSNDYGSRETWRSGDSRLSANNNSNKPLNYSSSSSSFNKYDSYGSGNHQSSSAQASSIAPYGLKRSSLSGSVGNRYSSKERSRGLSYSGSSLNRGGGDTYYPSSAKGYSAAYNSNPKLIDRYSSIKSSRLTHSVDYVKLKQPSTSQHHITTPHEKDFTSSSIPSERVSNIKKDQSEEYSSSPGPEDESKLSEDEEEEEEEEEDEEIDTSKLDLSREISRDENDEIPEEEEQEEEEGDEDEEDDEEEEEEIKEPEIEEEISQNKKEETEIDQVKTKTSENNEVKATEVIETKVEEVKVKPTVAKVDVSNEICYPDGCKFPLNRLEYEFEKLELEFKKQTKHDDGLNYLQYTLAKPILNLKDYTFYNRNFKIFMRRKGKLIDSIKHKNDLLYRKKLSLWNEYSKGLQEWEIEREKMDQQLRILHPPDDDMRREIDSSDNKKLYSQQYTNTNNSSTNLQEEAVNEGSPTGTGRRARRHGDLVTTEAEFQEILKSLEKEQDEDPMIKANRVSAYIPDLILDPVQRDVVAFMDANNIVNDKAEWATRVKTDFVSNFSESEHELFCEGFCLHPKRFGAISRHMGGLRTASDCVIHYYITKKAVNYKQLLVQHKKKSSKKVGRRGKPGRSRNVSQVQIQPPEAVSTEDTPVDGKVEQVNSVPVVLQLPVTLPLPVQQVQQEPNSEELFTETGRRKRAAAPVFDGTVKKPENTPTNEVTPTSDELDQAAIPLKKKQRRKKEDSLEAGEVNFSSNESIIKDEDETGNTDTAQEEQTDSQVNTPTNPNIDPKDRKRNISSYWSIVEANFFPLLLQKHGTKWTTIADELNTKTATMVRNYFQRNAEKNGWNAIAVEADARLEAKFAAVLQTSGGLTTNPDAVNNEASKEPRKIESSGYIPYPQLPQQQQQPIPPQVSGPPVATFIPMGTFQHAQAPMVNVMPPKFNVGPSISSLLSDNPAPTPSNNITQHIMSRPPEIIHRPPPLPTFIQPRTEPVQRASIMSLLNSDSSPVKVEPQPPLRPIIHNPITQIRKNSLHDLLNSPSSEPSVPNPSVPNLYPPNVPPNGVKRNGIASLLSADPTPYNNGHNDHQ